MIFITLTLTLNPFNSNTSVHHVRVLQLRSKRSGVSGSDDSTGNKRLLAGGANSRSFYLLPHLTEKWCLSLLHLLKSNSQAFTSLCHSPCFLVFVLALFLVFGFVLVLIGLVSASVRVLLFLCLLSCIWKCWERIILLFIRFS
jgi:hypothetical protein